MTMSKYYVRTNEGAYLQGHANPTPLWTNKKADAEKLGYNEALGFADRVDNSLRKNVSIFLEQVDDYDKEFSSLKVKPVLEGIDEIRDEIEDVKQSVIDSLFTPIETDDVNHPVHYNQYSFAVIDIIDEVAPTYPVEIIAEMANVIKYVLRAPHKGQLKKDLGKIIWYTQRALDNLEEK